MAKNQSKSDRVLAEQLGEVTGQKQNITHAEALAEAAAQGGGDSGHRPAAKGKTDTATNDATPGDKPAAVARPKIAPGSTPAMVLAAHITDEALLFDHARLVKTDAANQATLDATGAIINKLAKKVGEKAVNLLRHRASPSNVQVYTRIGMEELLANGELTSKGLTDRFKTKYTDGTARAQANQIMNLFPALKVADRADKGTLTLNKDSVIVQHYQQAAKG